MADRSHRPIMSLAAAALLLGGLVVAVAHANLPGRADAVLADGYGRALADADTHWSSTRSENLWLSRLGDQPVVLRKAIMIGDRITVGGNAHADTFEVVGLEQIDGEGLGQPSLRIQVVTARIDGSATTETVRFLFAVEAPTTVAPALLPEKVL